MIHIIVLTWHEGVSDLLSNPLLPHLAQALTSIVTQTLLPICLSMRGASSEDGEVGDWRRWSSGKKNQPDNMESLWVIVSAWIVANKMACEPWWSQILPNQISNAIHIPTIPIWVTHNVRTLRLSALRMERDGVHNPRSNQVTECQMAI